MSSASPLWFRKLPIISSEKRKFFPAFFHPKWRLLCLLFFESFLQHALLLKYGEYNKQYPLFDAQICEDISPRTLSVLRSDQSTALIYVSFFITLMQRTSLKHHKNNSPLWYTSNKYNHDGEISMLRL